MGQLPKDCNRTIHLVLKTLLTKKKQLGTTLHLQLDGMVLHPKCAESKRHDKNILLGAGENKNKWVIAFAAFLVSLEIYDTVRLHYRLHENLLFLQKNC